MKHYSLFLVWQNGSSHSRISLRACDHNSKITLFSSLSSAIFSFVKIHCCFNVFYSLRQINPFLSRPRSANNFRFISTRFSKENSVSFYSSFPDNFRSYFRSLSTTHTYKLYVRHEPTVTSCHSDVVIPLNANRQSMLRNSERNKVCMKFISIIQLYKNCDFSSVNNFCSRSCFRCFH